MLRIAFYREKTSCLGPFSRFALWVQGCEKNCPGCIAQNHKSQDGGFLISEEEIAKLVLKQTDNEGITISGGEPMLQAESLQKLIQLIRQEREDYGVIVYTGYTYQELVTLSKEDIHIEDFLNQIDLLIDGEYVDVLNDECGYVGSSNQTIIALSNRYKKIINEFYEKQGRKTELVFDRDKTLLVGIPSRDTMKIWKKIKENMENV